MEVTAIPNRSTQVLNFFILCTVFLLPFEITILATSTRNLTHIFRYAFTIPLCISIVLWLVIGMPGFSDMIRSTKHRIWMVFGILFAVWMVMSHTWAYDPTKVYVFQSAFKFSLAFSFTIIMVCHPPPLRWMSKVIMVSLVINSMVGIVQTLTNNPLGLEFLGEPVVYISDPLRVFTSEFIGGARVRSYGLTNNPNILGGILITQLFWCALWLKSPPSLLLRRVAIGVGLIGLLALFTSFSRGAWVGLAGVSLLTLLIVIRDWNKLHTQFKRFFPIITLASIGFSVIFAPYIFRRFSLSGVGTALDNPISARFIHSYVAWEAVKESPIIGIGAGSIKYFSWRYGEEHITFPYINDYPHNILLYILEESGIIGFMLWFGMMSAGIGIIINYAPHNTDYDKRIILFGGALAMLMAGIFDHYPISIFSTQILWLISFGYAISLKTIRD